MSFVSLAAIPLPSRLFLAVGFVVGFAADLGFAWASRRIWVLRGFRGGSGFRGGGGFRGAVGWGGGVGGGWGGLGWWVAGWGGGVRGAGWGCVSGCGVLGGRGGCGAGWGVGLGGWQGWMEHEKNGDVLEHQKTKKHKGKHDKPKPWDDDPNIDRWKIEKFDPSWNESGMLAKSAPSPLSSLSTEKRLARGLAMKLKEYGISCDIIKISNLVRNKAIKILDDEVQCDIIKISNLVRNKNTIVPMKIHCPGNIDLQNQMLRNERFVKRRQHLVGPNSSTLKALEILSSCYILVQGNTVSAMGSFKGLKQVRRIVEDCLLNKMHPVYHIKVLMMKKELEKDPALAEENWDRFLPKFKKKNVQQKKVKAKEKKPYTPFPPPQQPSKIDEQLESGEYFMSQNKKSAKKWQEKLSKQAEKTAENKRKREAAFIPPEESRKEDTKSNDDNKDVAAMARSLKKKAKEFGQQKLAENVNAEDYIASAGEPSKKKKKSKRTES
uniref:KRR1 small subunit processome component second KH domain-containing protein n=1 Tax=Fagus sylvatica TaxID=28930 RepID=A0A2N9IPT3_FAGSY